MFLIEITDTDNRDPHTTQLTVMAGSMDMDDVHFEINVEVDPMELMENAIDNMPEEGILEDIRRAWKVLKDLIETPME